jgi:hypothetical protein
MKRHGLYGGTALLTAAVLMFGGPDARAQTGPLGEAYGGYGAGDYPVPGTPAERIPIPTGNPGEHGFFTFFEFMQLTTTWTLGDQTVAYRGLVDATGAVTGVPGTYIGSGVPALSTDQFPRRSWMPGFNVGFGYKLDDGTSVHFSYIHLMDRNYHTGATAAAPFFRSRADLADTYLVSGVYNFPPQFGGPNITTPIENTLGGNVFYGIWNGAEVMDIQYNQRFQQGEIGARVPMFQTEYSRVYALAGGRFDWFWERFEWRTQKLDINGNTGPIFTADYKNTLSQRMYGPYVGCGHEIYVGNRFSLASDLTAAGLLNIVKERAKYKLESNDIQNKLSRDEYTVVPSLTANLNLMWYPIEGVQLRLGYNAWTFFNTKNMINPIGFNYGSIDPVYDTQVFRIVHGFNAGVGLFF